MRSRTSSLPRSACRARAFSSPPRRTVARRSRSSAASSAMPGARAVCGSAVSVIALDLLRRAERVDIRPMSDDREAPISYLTLEPGTPVLTSDGAEIGRVEHVLADADADIFDGIVIDVSRGPGGHRFVDAPQVAHIASGGVTLTLDAAAADALREPSETPAEMAADPDEGHESGLTRKLRRAWDMISGNY